MGNWLQVFTLKYFSVLLPQSLRARLIMLVLATVLAGQAATLYTVSQFQRDHSQTVALDLVATTIRTLQYSMDHISMQDRAGFVSDASQGQWRLWSKPLPNEARLQRRPASRPGPPTRGPQRQAQPAPTAETSAQNSISTTVEIPPPSGPHQASKLPNRPDQETDDVRRSLSQFINRLNNRLDGDSRVALSRGPRPELYISLTRPSENAASRVREWLVIPIDRLDPPLTTSLIVWWSAGLALVLLIAIWFSWHISRPITSLVQATDQLAAGKPARVEPAGPSETRLLGERFNAMLDALSQSESTRRTLLAGLPHDLKAPLARMWLRIEMTEDLALKNGMRTDLQDMQQMVDQFIHFLRGTDLATYRFAPLSLHDWLEERVGNWQGAADGEVVLTGIPAQVTVNADSVALSRLLDNLVSNALHHGAAPVHVALSVQGQWAQLNVSDHGPGIAPELRDNALKPFVRLDEARTRTGNVGLGLALSEAIARAHGGTLTLGQGPESGLQVQVLLPVYPPEP